LTFPSYPVSVFGLGAFAMSCQSKPSCRSWRCRSAGSHGQDRYHQRLTVRRRTTILLWAPESLVIASYANQNRSRKRWWWENVRILLRFFLYSLIDHLQYQQQQQGRWSMNDCASKISSVKIEMLVRKLGLEQKHHLLRSRHFRNGSTDICSSNDFECD
jgi:hypothetical protein